VHCPFRQSATTVERLQGDWPRTTPIPDRRSTSKDLAKLAGELRLVAAAQQGDSILDPLPGLHLYEMAGVPIEVEGSEVCLEVSPGSEAVVDGCSPESPDRDDIDGIGLPRW
jgi:hypothetical protein